MSLVFIDGQRQLRYMAVQGAGTEGDPLKVIHGVYPENSIQRTPTLSTVSTTGTIAAGCVAVSVANTGAANGTLLGQTIAPGVVIDYVAPWGDTIGAIAYNATGTTFLIQELR